MGRILFLAVFLSFTLAGLGQNWIVIPDTKILMLDSAANASLGGHIAGFRSGSKLILVDSAAKRDFIQLFTDDKAAFDTIYGNAGRMKALFFLDSTDRVLLGVGEKETLVRLHARKIEKAKQYTVWRFFNPYKDGRPCDTGLFLRQKIRDKRKVYYLYKVGIMCEL